MGRLSALAGFSRRSEDWPESKRSHYHVARPSPGRSLDNGIAVVATRTCEFTIFTSNLSMRSRGTPCTQPVITSYCQSQREQITRRPRSAPEASEAPQRRHESSMAKSLPSTLKMAIALSATLTTVIISWWGGASAECQQNEIDPYSHDRAFGAQCPGISRQGDVPPRSVERRERIS